MYWMQKYLIQLKVSFIYVLYARQYALSPILNILIKNISYLAILPIYHKATYHKVTSPFCKLLSVIWIDVRCILLSILRSSKIKKALTAVLLMVKLNFLFIFWKTSDWNTTFVIVRRFTKIIYNLSLCSFKYLLRNPRNLLYGCNITQYYVALVCVISKLFFNFFIYFTSY